MISSDILSLFFPRQPASPVEMIEFKKLRGFEDVMRACVKLVLFSESIRRISHQTSLFLSDYQLSVRFLVTFEFGCDVLVKPENERRRSML